MCESELRCLTSCSSTTRTHALDGTGRQPVRTHAAAECRHSAAVTHIASPHLGEPTPPPRLTDGERRLPCTCWQRCADDRKKKNIQSQAESSSEKRRELQRADAAESAFQAFLCVFFRFSSEGNYFSSRFPTA